MLRLARSIRLEPQAGQGLRCHQGQVDGDGAGAQSGSIWLAGCLTRYFAQNKFLEKAVEIYLKQSKEFILREISRDRKSTRLNSSHRCISYAVFCLKKKIPIHTDLRI